MRYPVGTSGQTLVLTDSVLAHFDRHRQRKWLQSEAGGQLFARIERAEIRVEEATGPRRTDRRTRMTYHADRAEEQHEIDTRYPQGLHYVGDWHTHPTAHPEPSLRDLTTISETVCRSSHSLNAFVLIIVGTDCASTSLCVLLHDGRNQLRLHPEHRLQKGESRGADGHALDANEGKYSPGAGNPAH